jgi:hypothetical protein
MQKWEYLAVTDTPGGPTLQQILNAHGQQGWELVTAQYYQFQGKDFLGLIFKRPKS